MTSELPQPRATIRRRGAVAELVDERGEVLLVVVVGGASDGAEVAIRLVSEGRARGYRVKLPDGLIG